MFTLHQKLKGGQQGTSEEQMALHLALHHDRTNLGHYCGRQRIHLRDFLVNAVFPSMTSHQKLVARC